MDFAARKAKAIEQVKQKLREPIPKDRILVNAWRCDTGRALALEHWLFNIFPELDPQTARERVKKEGREAWDPEGRGAQMDDMGWETLIRVCKGQAIDLDKLAAHAGRNVHTLLGAHTMAAMIEGAGSIQALANMTQRDAMVLGAEKRVFGGRPDKSILENHELATSDRALRVLSSRAVLAARLDAFKGQYKGDSLRQEVLYAQ